MRNIQELDKGLLQSEFEKARSIYEMLRGQGYAPLKAAAIIYRYGVLDGRDSQRAPLDAAYKELRALRAAMPAETTTDSQPEAIIEGSDTDE